MKVSLKAFVTSGITLLTGLVTSLVIFIYTDIIKKEVYLSAEQEIQRLFERDKKTVVKMIQLGTFLDLNQHLSSSYKDEPLVRKVEISSDDEVVASYEVFSGNNKTALKEYHYPLVEHGQTWGIVTVLVDQQVIGDKIDQRLKGLYLTGLIILVITVLLAYLFSVLLTREVNKIVVFISKRHQAITNASDLNDLESKLEDHTPPMSYLKEITSLSKVFDNFLVIVKDANSRLNKLENEARLGQQAQQIAHDIRSPLEVLKGLRQDLQILPEGSKRRVQMSIQRIEEIAHNLLKTNKNSSTTSGNRAQPEELLSILEGIIIEKKIEYSSKATVEISNNFDSSSYGLLSKVRRGALKRVISNLVNNGIDALEERSGIIKIGLYSEGEWNVIEVSDTGVGVPEGFKDKLFKRGFTSKEKGNGLGLSGAMEEISSVGGRINFDSKRGEGTTFRIYLPKSETTANFVKAIDVYKYQKVIILDDDPTFHEIWISKFETVKDKVESFFSIKEMFHKYDELPSGCLLLSDFELMDDEYNGIDAILKYKTPKDSFLVTAMSEEISVQERCSREGIKLLPKTIINYIKINVTPPSVILIDDDKLIRVDWKTYFESTGTPFKSFATIDKFIEESSSIEKESIIYIDSSLGNGVRGEVESEKLYNLGFLNLFLSTGYQKDDIKKPTGGVRNPV